jgi:hypothetical protein
MHVTRVLGLGAKFNPMRALGSHRGKDLLEAKELFRANTGQPKVCKNHMLDPTLIELNSSILDWPSGSIGSTLLR